MAIWFDIQGCAFSSHKDSEWAVILFIKLSPFEWQYGLTYKAAPCRSNHIAILKDIGDTTKTVNAQFILHYAFQSDNRSSSGEILQTHKDKAAPFGKTKIVSGFLMVFSNCFH